VECAAKAVITASAEVTKFNREKPAEDQLLLLARTASDRKAIVDGRAASQ